MIAKIYLSIKNECDKEVLVDFENDSLDEACKFVWEAVKDGGLVRISNIILDVANLNYIEIKEYKGKKHADSQ